MSKKLTIRDVAKITGYSRSTISLVLNNSPGVGEETRKKVWKAIEELDYHPNIFARRLAEKRSKIMGVVVPQLMHVFSDYYFSEAISGISEACVDKGYRLMLETATPEYIASRQPYRAYREKQVDAMLFLGTSQFDSYISELGALNFPLMMVNSCLDEMDYVIADNIGGGMMLVEHLHELGHRDIAIIGGPGIVTTSIHRLQGYIKGFEKCGLTLRDAWIHEGDFSEESGYEVTMGFLAAEQKPTAIIALNDMMAIGAIRAVTASGLKVPDDIAVVGGDDIVLAHYFAPPITTIRQSMFHIGHLAASEMIAKLNKDEKSEKIKIEVPMELIVRDSCGSKVVLNK